MCDLSKLKIFCDTVIEHWASISLNGFGTGFSPLNNLCQLPASYIKIDKSFTQKVGYGGRSDILINHLIKLAHEMNIKAIAEGIEHTYQRDQLIKYDCDQLQGFLMCEPLARGKITTDKIHMPLMKL